MSTFFNIDFYCTLDTIFLVEQIKRVKKCIEPICGVHFLGGSSSKYCPECRSERNMYSTRKSNIKTGRPLKIAFGEEKEKAWFGQVFFKTKSK